MLTHSITVAVLGLREQQVALIQDQAHWALPHATIKAGESPVQVALHVAQTQIGLPIKIDRLWDVWQNERQLLLVYRAHVGAGLPAAHVSFFAPDQLPLDIVSALQQAALDDWKKRAQRAQRARLPAPPQAAYCPRCGSEHLSVQEKFGRKRLACEVCDFVFFRDPKVGAGVFIIEEGRLLLVRRGVNPGMGLWCLPSGFIEHDESPEKAAIREAKEETGLDVAIDELMGLNNYLDPGRGNGILILYRAHAVGGVLRPGDDAQEAKYFAADELPPPIEIAFRTHRLVLQEWRSKQLAQSKR